MAVFLSWRFLEVSGAGGAYVPGTLDPRGFKVHLTHPETGEPARFNVCRPIHYVINPALAPEGGVADVHRAFEMTGRAMGANFVYDGTTDEHYAARDAFQPDRYGDRWAPILVSWSDHPPHVDPSSAGTVVGMGGPAIEYNEEDRAVLVSGIVVLDASADLSSGFAGATWGQVILHELGHVFGLAHIDDEASVMHERMGLRPAAFGPGDREGLWELGVGSGCVETPRLPWL